MQGYKKITVGGTPVWKHVNAWDIRQLLIQALYEDEQNGNL